MLVLFLNLLGRFFFLFCRREVVANQKFHSKEVEEEAKKVLKELLYLPKRLVMVCLMFRTSQWRHKVLK
jgi:hypothetical protein